MKRNFKIAGLLLLLLMTVAVMAACGGKGGDVSGIAVEKMQQKYVEGQELDLANSTITVTRGKKIETVAMLPENGVTVSGYDANKLGEQTLTVAYGGQTATVTVTVVARLVVSNGVSEYLIGDAFDNSKGKLTFNKEDGTSTDIRLNDNAVTLVSFDSSKAAENVPVTVRYHAGDGKDYEVSFPVTVFQPEIVLTKPRKNAYRTYDTEVDLSGGYFTLKAGSTINRPVKLYDNPDVTVEGFDTSIAVDPEKTYDMELTIHYQSLTYSYKVALTYSFVTLIRERLPQIASIDWTGAELPELTAEQGDCALGLLELYNALSSAEKSVLNVDEKNLIARTAAVYGQRIWTEKMEAHNEAFALVNNNGTAELRLKPTTLPAVSAAVQMLSNSDSEAYSLAQLLNNMTSDFPACKVGEQSLSDYIRGTVAKASAVTTLYNKLAYVEALCNALEVVPDDWTVEGLKTENYAQAIQEAAGLITGSSFYGHASSHSDVYQALLSIREDYFEIVYRHFITNLGQDATVRQLASNAYLYVTPKVQELINRISVSQKQLNLLNSSRSDTASFMLYCSETLDLANELMMHGETLEAWMYRNLSVGGTSINYMVTALRTDCYFAVMGGYMGDAGYEQLWAHYIEVIETIRTTEQLNSEKESLNANIKAEEEKPEADRNTEDLEKWNARLEEIATELTDAEELRNTRAVPLFEEFLSLPATVQRCFLDSLNLTYSEKHLHLILETVRTEVKDNDGNPVLGDDGEPVVRKEVRSYFAQCVVNGYAKLLSDDGILVFEKLMVAVEHYAQGNFAEFSAAMEQVSNGYQALAAESGDLDVLKPIYDQYLGIAAHYDAEGNHKVADLTDEEEARLQTLKALIETVYTNYNYLDQKAYYCALFASYEAAETYLQEILASGGQALAENYYYRVFTFGEGEKAEHVTLEYALYTARQRYIFCLEKIRVELNGITVPYLSYYYYESENLRAFMAKLSVLTEEYIRYQNDKTYHSAMTAAQVAEILEAYRAMNPAEKVYFHLMDNMNGMQMYYNGLYKVLGEQMSEQAVNVARLLVKAELAYVNYSNNIDEPEKGVTGTDNVFRTHRKVFEDSMEELTAAYEALTADEKTAFDAALGGSYGFYTEAYQNLPAEG